MDRTLEAVGAAIVADLGRQTGPRIELRSCAALTGGLDNLLIRLQLEPASVPRDWPSDVVARILPDRASAKADSEAAKHRFLEREGYPAPRLLAHGVVAEGPYLLIPFIDGVVGGEAILRVWKLAGLAASMADLQCRLHDLPSHEWPPDSPKPLQYWLDELLAVRDLPGGPQPAALAWLTSNATRLHDRPLAPCHFDFHLLNLMISQSGQTTVLDWDLAALGDPVADFAFSLEILSIVPAALAPGPERAIGSVLLRRFNHKFEKALRRRVDLPADDLTYWRALYTQLASAWAQGVPVAGAQSRAEAQQHLEAMILVHLTRRFSVLTGVDLPRPSGS